MRASKTQKPAFAKTLKNPQLFKVFGVQRPPKRALRCPRRLPRGTKGAPKAQQKGIQKLTLKLSFFKLILVFFLRAILGSKSSQKGVPKLDKFWKPLAPHKRGPGEAILRIKQEWCNCYSYWKYIRQKKERDFGGPELAFC